MSGTDFLSCSGYSGTAWVALAEDHKLVGASPDALLNHLFSISRLLAGQLDFRSAIRAVSTEIAQILPHDHLDVCILRQDGQFHTA